jgi:glyoxylase-like metal-dependent hydrolase (beta-lactamase superfamily II)
MVTKGETSVLFTGDTAPTERIWNVARDTHGLKAVFTEMSFPAELQWLADVSRHFSAVTFERELRKMRDLNVPIYIGHFKPGLEGKLAKEYKQRKLASYGVQILNQGEIFKFDSRTRERTRGLLVQTHIQAKYSNRKY